MSALTWAKDTAERVLATVAEVLVPLVAADGFDLFAVDWKAYVSVAGGAAALTFLKAVAARGKGNPESASLAD